MILIRLPTGVQHHGVDHVTMHEMVIWENNMRSFGESPFFTPVPGPYSQRFPAKGRADLPFVTTKMYSFSGVFRCGWAKTWLRRLRFIVDFSFHFALEAEWSSSSINSFFLSWSITDMVLGGLQNFWIITSIPHSPPSTVHLIYQKISSSLYRMQMEWHLKSAFFLRFLPTIFLFATCRLKENVLFFMIFIMEDFIPRKEIYL